MKKLLFVSLAVVLALSMALVGCGGTPSQQEEEEEEEPATYTLTIASGLGGDVTTPTEGETYTHDEGDVVNLAATAFGDYEFAAWTGDVDDVADVNAASTTITMNGDAEITATFEWAGSALWDYDIPLDVHFTSEPYHSASIKTFVPWSTALEEAVGDDGGTFTLDVTWGAQPWTAEDSLYSVSEGVSDIGMISPETFDLGGIGYIPFLFPDMAEATYACWYIYEEDEAVWQGDLKQLKDVKVLLTVPLMPAQLVCTQNITEPDLQGLNTRADGQETDTVEALNGVPKGGIGFMQTGTEIQKGTIDAAFLTYDAILKTTSNLYADYVTETNLFIRPYIVGINKEVYEGMHPDARALLDSLSGLQNSLAYNAAHKGMEGGKKAELIAYYAGLGQGGVYTLDATEQAAWAAATAGLEGTWIADMDALGYDGAGLVAEAKALVAEYQASH